MAVEALERNYSPIKKPRFVKPYGKRGIKKDGLVQMQIASLVGVGKVTIILFRDWSEQRVTERENQILTQ